MFGKLFDWFRLAGARAPKAEMSRSDWTVTVDSGTLVIKNAKATAAPVSVDDLHGIHIQTTSDGPFFSDVWWWLAGRDDEVLGLFPGDARGAQEAVDVLTRLDGFNHRVMVQAMGCTDDALFPLWVRPIMSADKKAKRSKRRKA
jgi:hypothetical protein